MQLLDNNHVQHSGDMTLYDRYASLIFTYVRRQVAHSQDAEDILLEVFMAALKYQQFANLDQEKQIAWLQRVARNKIVDKYRQNARATLLPLEQALERLDEQLTPEQHVIRQETFEQLYSVLAKLPAIQQQIIYLRFVEGLRFAEIGVIVNKSEANVRAIVGRTLRRLRALYEQR